MKEKIYRKIVFGLVIISVMWIIAPAVWAESCPSLTSVNGTSVTFVGGLADMGGDTQASVWFEYGLTSGNYSQKTEEKVLTQMGKYCITVLNLQPCTTYYYRAAMRNKAGPSYGAEQSRTTACSTSTPKKVLGAATGAPTGLADSIFMDSIFLPLVSALTLTWLLKSHILKWEEWLDKNKRDFGKFKSEKLLKLKIAQIKARKSK